MPFDDPSERQKFRDDVLDKLTRIDERGKTWDEWKDEIDYVLNGNGRPGLISEVAELKSEAKRRAKLATLFWTMVAGNATAIIVAIGWFAKHF